VSIQGAGLLVAIVTGVAALVTAAITAIQQYRYGGASAAIAWRQQVIDLHDRGLSPAQIRQIMALEKGGKGYERSNGKIDDIVRAIPRGRPVP
jgi:hypothetical protein